VQETSWQSKECRCRSRALNNFDYAASRRAVRPMLGGLIGAGGRLKWKRQLALVLETLFNLAHCRT
jgi:hypothetical protein